MTIQIFINELSLHEQYNSGDDFIAAVRIFNTIFKSLRVGLDNLKNNGEDHDCAIYRDNAYHCFPVAGTHICSIKWPACHRDLRELFYRNYFNNNSDWRNKQLHKYTDSYCCITIDDNVTGTSLAELAERKLKKDKLNSFIINFTYSIFHSCSEILVTKNGADSADIDTVEDDIGVNNWLNKCFEINRRTYPQDANRPPTDEETILYNTKRFKRTNLTNQGRMVYIESNTKYYWYLDNMHVGGNAHFEVFNFNRCHIGEADLRGNIDRSKAINGRTLDN
ncbi:MAG: hypothetical protein HQK95_01285 [Nitrospirae bacterium]|nr:hypothetical protein [Nitrospirota bacterium]